MTNKLTFKLIFIYTLTVSIGLAGDIFYAKLYPEGEPDNLVYIHTNKITEIGDTTIFDHYYHTPEGQLHAHDQVVLVKGEPVSNFLNFDIIEEHSSFVRQGDMAELSFEYKGKKKTHLRDLKTPLIFAPSQQYALRGYLEQLLKGETAIFYIFAPETVRLVKMKVQVLEGSQYQKPGCVVLQMKPNNFFIDWLVDEVYYVINIETGRIMEQHGFSTIRVKEGDKWEFKDLDFYYSYE